MILDLSTDTFHEKITSSHFVLVDFWAEWCGPCRRMHSILEEVAENFKDQVLFCKLNIDTHQEIATRYKIMSIPTLILFSKGEPEETKVGYMDEGSLTEWLQHCTARPK